MWKIIKMLVLALFGFVAAAYCEDTTVADLVAKGTTVITAVLAGCVSLVLLGWGFKTLFWGNKKVGTGLRQA